MFVVLLIVLAAVVFVSLEGGGLDGEDSLGEVALHYGWWIIGLAFLAAFIFFIR